MQESDFKKVNGFSNKFYGWGAEDDDMYSRLEEAGLSVVRFDPKVASYIMLSHPHHPPAADRFLKLQDKKDEDGLTGLTYKVVDRSNKPLYTWILVSC